MRRRLLNKAGAGGGNFDANGYEYVDLGLPSGLLWATCNVGAENPWNYGHYYTWGGSTNRSNSDYYTGYGDLPISRDTARNKMGGDWRIPTKVELEELINGCTGYWTVKNGVYGYLLTSKKNSQTIFFPATGWVYDNADYEVGSYGNYWSSSGARPGRVYILYFVPSNLSITDDYSEYAFPVRGVIDPNNPL